LVCPPKLDGDLLFKLTPLDPEVRTEMEKENVVITYDMYGKFTSEFYSDPILVTDLDMGKEALTHVDFIKSVEVIELAYINTGNSNTTDLTDDDLPF
jgi:hypothetical protein